MYLIVGIMVFNKLIMEGKMNNGKEKKFGSLSAFILGGIAGSVLTFLFTPYSGKELRNKIEDEVNTSLKKAKQKEDEIINKAKSVADDIMLKTTRLAAFVDKYAGAVDWPPEKIDKEIKSIKAAIDAAIKSYDKEYIKAEEAGSTNNIVEDIFSGYDNERLPKHEGMRRRR